MPSGMINAWSITVDMTRNMQDSISGHQLLGYNWIRMKRDIRGFLLVLFLDTGISIEWYQTSVIGEECFIQNRGHIAYFLLTNFLQSYSAFLRKSYGAIFVIFFISAMGGYCDYFEVSRHY